MSLAWKVACLVEAIRRQDLEAMPRANRRLLASRCRQIAETADAIDRQEPRPGILAELAARRREG